MNKNGQYVGVDEKYIPENEKYVENGLNSKIKDDMHEMYRSAKSYVTNTENQEKIKTTGRKGWKVVKGVAIFHFVVPIIVFLLIIGGVIIIFALIVPQFSKTFNGVQSAQEAGMPDKVSSVIDQAANTINNAKENLETNKFNADIELYRGTQRKNAVSSMLDNVVTKIKKGDGQIMVSFGETSTSNADEIIALKTKLSQTKEYEVILDYDAAGFVNKVTITEY